MKNEVKSTAARAERGFSMIELMIALTIIFIVSAIAITQLTPNMQQARVTDDGTAHRADAHRHRPSA